MINLRVVVKLILFAVATPSNRLLFSLCALAWMVESYQAEQNHYPQEVLEAKGSRGRALLLRCDNKWPSQGEITCSITQNLDSLDSLDVLSSKSCHTSMANPASDSRRDCGRWRAQEGSRWIFGLLTYSAAQASLLNIQRQSENDFLSLHWSLGISH